MTSSCEQCSDQRLPKHTKTGCQWVNLQKSWWMVEIVYFTCKKSKNATTLFKISVLNLRPGRAIRMILITTYARNLFTLYFVGILLWHMRICCVYAHNLFMPCFHRIKSYTYMLCVCMQYNHALFGWDNIYVFAVRMRAIYSCFVWLGLYYDIYVYAVCMYAI